MEVKGSNLDFALVVGSALRYGLGRRTYITGAISKFIIDNIKLIPNDQKLVMIRDIKEKEYYGDDCDKENWMKLLAELEKSVACFFKINSKKCLTERSLRYIILNV